jgi:hypothetical protein
MTDAPLLETPKQLAVRTGFSERQIRNLIKNGKLERVRVNCHMLFHLAHPFFKGSKHTQVVQARSEAAPQ